MLDGRALAAQLRDEIAARSGALRARGIVPRLVVVIVGDDETSRAYARGLERAGAKAGVDVTIDALAADTGETALREHVRLLGDDRSVHGIILQQPLPAHLGIRRIAEALPAHKDVDGINPLNFGRLAFASGSELIPATPLAVLLLLEHSLHWPLRGARCCVVGRSHVVGLPVAMLLLARDATVTMVHRATRDLSARTREADVLVVAAGVPHLVGAGMVAPGATVIDVGTNYRDGVPIGDVALDDVVDVAGDITPVPGGVGPVTNVALLRNVVEAAERAHATDDVPRA